MVGEGALLARLALWAAASALCLRVRGGSPRGRLVSRIWWGRGYALHICPRAGQRGGGRGYGMQVWDAQRIFFFI